MAQAEGYAPSTQVLETRVFLIKLSLYFIRTVYASSIQSPTNSKMSPNVENVRIELLSEFPKLMCITITLHSRILNYMVAVEGFEPSRLSH